MTTRRTPIHRAGRARLTPAMRVKAERLLELHYDHSAAINGEDEKFYDDGRHEELVTLGPEVHRALGIRPWQDSAALLREALEAGDA